MTTWMNSGPIETAQHDDEVPVSLRGWRTPGAPRPTLSVVVPVFNEAAIIGELHRRLTDAMVAIGESWEVVYVNDGSRDATLVQIEALRDSAPHVALVNLSRNFGKEIATTAGLDHARGAAVIVMDGDLQDPPEVIPRLVEAWRGGADMVYAQRRARQGDTWLKKTTAALFYRVMSRLGDVPLPANVGDFRLMSRRVVDALLQLREQHRFMKGLFAWVGFPTAAVTFDREPRGAGTTNWSFWKLWNLAIEGITSFTVAPLRLATYLGLATAVFAAVFAAQLVVRTLVFGNSVAGYPSLMAVILFLGGVQLMTLGIIGEYLGRVFNETKRRPLYLVERYTPSRAVSPPASRSEADRRREQSGLRRPAARDPAALRSPPSGRR
jgi:glycosyltransferase involved in cell wall biosynthesis